MVNPFSVTFGKEPIQAVTRIEEKNNVISSFCSENPFSYAYIIEGVRGSGKTVLLSSIARELASAENWVVVEVNPERNIYRSIANRLCGIPKIKAAFLKAKINISIFGIGAELEPEFAVSDEEVVLELMLKQLKKLGWKVLILIDEASSSDMMRQFCLSFQMFIRNGLDIFLLMTGLFENIYELQNAKNLTFLLRTPKIRLSPLNLIDVKNKYMEVFPVSLEQAVYMAKLTKGYSFAFQVLGYLVWEQGEQTDIDAVIPEYDRYLREYVYARLYSGLSELEKTILKCIPDDEIIDVGTIKDKTGIKGNMVTNYKKRLVDKGLAMSPERGKAALALPRFGAYLKEQSLFE